MKILNPIKNFFRKLFGMSRRKDSGATSSLPDGVPQDAAELPSEDDAWLESGEVEGSEFPATSEQFGRSESQVPEPTLPLTKIRKPRYMWCLDNGHGKRTVGKRSPLFEDRKTRFFEYEFNRDIVKRIQKGLKARGISFFITVPEIDVDDFLQERVERANNLRTKLPRIFVSVHANAAPAASPESWAEARGIETWYFHGSKSGEKLASVFQKHLIAFTGFRDRKIKSRPESQFYVLSKTKMPAILTENGFFNHKAEALELMKPAVRQKIADAHVAAILEIERLGL